MPTSLALSDTTSPSAEHAYETVPCTWQILGQAGAKAGSRSNASGDLCVLPWEGGLWLMHETRSEDAMRSHSRGHGGQGSGTGTRHESDTTHGIQTT